METAIYADLEPGDAIFIPSLWWHCVEAYAPVNILVNYWYNAPTQSSPFEALMHAMLAVHDLPDAEQLCTALFWDHRITLALFCLSAFVMDAAGIHTIFGGLILGVVIARGSLSKNSKRRLNRLRWFCCCQRS